MTDLLTPTTGDTGRDGGDATSGLPTDPEERPTGRRSGLARSAAVVIPLAVYAGLSIWAYWPIGLLNPDRLVTCGCGDIAQENWFLAWTPHAIANAVNPFFTWAINVPVGVNMASNTPFPLLGVLAAPLTLTSGPVATYGLLLELAFFTSATAMYFVLRRWTVWWPAAFAGGLLYGFSPYMIGQGHGHLNLLFVPVPPLILAVLDNVLVRLRGSARLNGLILGGLVAAQYLISAEIMVDTVVVAVIGVAVLAIGHPRTVPMRVRRVLATGLWSLLPFGILAGYPAWFALFGAQRVTQPWWPSSQTGAFGSDLLGPVVPTTSQLFGGAHWTGLGSTFAGGNPVENGTYLGIPLLIVCAIFVVAFRKEAIIRFAGVMLVMSFLVSIGKTLSIENHATGIPTPFGWLYSLPLLQNMTAGRLSLFMQLFAALLLAVGVDRTWRWFRSPRHGRHHARPSSRHVPVRLVGATGTAVVIAVAALVPLFPRLPYPTTATGIPAYFTNDARRGADRIPAGSVVLAYPYPYNPDNQAMLWQAVSQIRFRIIGGYSIGPVSRGSSKGTLAPATLEPVSMAGLFNAGLHGSQGGAALPPLDAATLAQLREFCLRYQVSSIVVDPVGVRPEAVVKYLSTALGHPPVRYGGVYAWYHVQRLARAADSSSAAP